MVKDREAYPLSCLDGDILLNVVGSVASYPYCWKDWDGIWKSVLDKSAEETYHLLFSFRKLKDAIYPASEAFC